MKLKFVALIMVLIFNLKAQNTLILQPNQEHGKDAHLSQLNPTTNYGNHQDFIAYSWTFSGNEGLGKSLLEFDLSYIPKGSKIIDAKLSLFYNSKSSSAGQAGNNACYLKRLLSPWDENTVTWNNVPKTEDVNYITLAKSTNPSQDYLNIDLTQWVQDWYDNPTTNNGILLELIDESLYNSLKFCSSDCIDAQSRPKLEITYIETTDDCIILQPGIHTGKDAFIFQLQPTVNYANHVDFISFSWTFGGNEGLGNSLIQFDLQQVPVNSEIEGAYLSLFYNNLSESAGQAGNNACYLKKITTDWKENDVTWNNSPNIDTTGQVYLKANTLSNQNYKNIDITNFVKDWHSDPSSNHGIMLELIDKSLYNSLKFCSSENIDSTKSPQLIICYKIKNNVDQINNRYDFNIYPNPTRDWVTVETDNHNLGKTLEILNANGQSLLTQKIESEKTLIDIRHLTKGVYVMKFLSGQNHYFKKLIIE